MLREAGPGSGPPGLLGQWCVTLSNVDPRGPVSGLPGSQASGASSNMTKVLDLPIPGPAKTLIGQAPWQSHEHFFSHPLGSGSVAPHLLTLQPSPSPCNLTSLNKEEAPLWWAGGKRQNWVNRRVWQRTGHARTLPCQSCLSLPRPQMDQWCIL